MPKALAAAAALFLLASSLAAAQDALRVTGALVLRERIALPPQAEAVVTIRQGAGRDLGEARIRLGGRQPPIPFEIDASKAALDPARPLIAQGRVLIGGETKWLTDPQVVEIVKPETKAGELLLRPSKALSFSTRYSCGGRIVRLGAEGDAVVLEDGAERLRLRQTEAGSGVRYEAEGDSATVFWTKGREASYALRGAAPVDCREAQPQPRAARLRGEWRIVEIAGAPLAPGSQARLRLGPRDALYGMATCSRFEGVFFANAEGLRFGKIGVEPGACPAGLAAQDKAVLGALDAVQRAEAAGPGRIVLMGEAGPLLTLAR